LSPDRLRPDEIGDSFVPRLRDGVALVAVEDEAVLYEEGSGALHQLDAIATVVCNLFDGKSSVDVLVKKLVESFVGDPAAIKSDVLDMVRCLESMGLIEGDDTMQGVVSDPESE
jgi:hypothetical protein